MKSIRSRVLSSMPKEETVELQAEQIELSSLKELKQYISILKANAKESEKEGELYIKAEAELQRAWARLNGHRNSIYSNAVSSAPSVIKDFESKVKELGLSADDVKEVKELKKEIENIKEYIKLFDKVSKPKSQL